VRLLQPSPDVPFHSCGWVARELGDADVDMIENFSALMSLTDPASIAGWSQAASTLCAIHSRICLALAAGARRMQQARYRVHDCRDPSGAPAPEGGRLIDPIISMAQSGGMLRAVGMDLLGCHPVMEALLDVSPRSQVSLDSLDTCVLAMKRLRDTSRLPWLAAAHVLGPPVELSRPPSCISVSRSSSPSDLNDPGARTSAGE